MDKPKTKQLTASQNLTASQVIAQMQLLSELISGLRNRLDTAFAKKESPPTTLEVLQQLKQLRTHKEQEAEKLLNYDYNRAVEQEMDIDHEEMLIAKHNK